MQEAGHGPRPPRSQERPLATGFCCRNRQPQGGSVSNDRFQVSFLAPSQDVSPAGQQKPPFTVVTLGTRGTALCRRGQVTQRVRSVLAGVAMRGLSPR